MRTNKKNPKVRVQNWYKDHEFIHGILPRTLEPSSLFPLPSFYPASIAFIAFCPWSIVNCSFY